MKHKHSSLHSILTQFLALSLGLTVAGISPFGSPSAQATSLYWDTNGTSGGSGTSTGTWGTSNFWNSDSTGGAGGSFTTSTGSGDDLFFNANSAGSTGTVTVNGTQSANTITLQTNVAVPLTTGTIALTSGATNQTATGWNIGAAVSLAGSSQLWTINGAGNINLNGLTTVNASNVTLTKAGAGAGVLSLAGGLTFNSSSGTTFATSGTTAANTSIGNTTFSSGTSAMTVSGSAFTLTGNITNNSTSTQTINNAITLNNATHTFAATSGNIALGGNFSGATTRNATFTGSGTTTLSGTNAFNMNGGGNNSFYDFAVGTGSGTTPTSGNLSITGATTVDGSTGTGTQFWGYLSVIGNSNLTIESGGSLDIKTSAATGISSGIGQNATGTSTLVVNGGSFSLNGNTGLFLGNNRTDATGVITINSGTATINRGSTTATDVRSFISLGRDTGTGIINLNGGTLATDRNFVRDGSGTADVTGAANFVFGGGTLKALANQTDWLNSATINTNQLALSSVTTTAVSTIDANGFSVAINSAISGAGGFNINSSTGTGTVTFGGGNSYTGATTVSAGTLKAGVASVANTSGAFGNNSAVTMANVAGATLDITGFNTQIGSLAGGGATGGNVTLGAATLTTGGTDKSGSYAGVISGTSGSLTKIGTGTQTLTGSNTYTGATTISGGILQIGNGGTSGSISGTSGVADNATLAYNRSDSLNVAYSISGSGNVKQIGTGTTTVTGNNSYSGTTTISSGTWKVNGLHTSAGAYTVQNGGTLGGSGTITTASNAGITLDTGGKLSPGNSPGTLTADLGSGVFDISAGVNANNSQSLLFDLTTTSASDRVLLSNASSTFNIGSGVLEFDDFVFTTGGGFGAGVYTLLDGSNAGGITGTLGTNLSGMLAGYNAVISFGNGGLVSGLSSTEDIILTVTAVPEPATYGALAGLALTGLSLTSVIRRRGKGMRA